MENIKATYWIETAHSLEKAAEVLAGEQSSGTFLAVPGETPELKRKHGAKIEHAEMIGESLQPSLPGSSLPANSTSGIYKQAILKVSWPISNIGTNLSNLMATVAGNLFELKQFSGLRLLDVEIPESYYSKYLGPQFGIEGTRKLTNVYDRPVIGTIIKPSVGLSPAETAEQTKTLTEAGLDFLKDDELMGDSPHSPFEKRVDAVMKVINNAADKTGKKPMFAFNISGDIDDMLYRHDYVLKNGGTCVMISLLWTGISAIEKLRKHSSLPIHGHRNGWGLMSRSPHIGIDFTAYQKIWRIAGVDQLHTNGLQNKFCEEDGSVIKSITACQKKENNMTVMPVVSSGQWAGQAVDTFKAIGNADLMFVCGGGIVAHPSGIAAGVKSVQQAWDAAINGVSLESYATQHVELKQALDFFGKRK
ncbi:MAG: ribulose-bisphosphate carboxylase large subunit family protein [Chitinophagaceae bacterium]